MDGKITFEIHYEEGSLPEVFPEARTRVSRAAKAAAKAAAQESTEVMAVEAAEPEIEAAPQESPQTDEIPEENPEEKSKPEYIEAAYNVTGVRRKQLILVDHNEKAQAVEGVENARILEIIDQMLTNSLAAVFYSGEIYAGEADA